MAKKTTQDLVKIQLLKDLESGNCVFFVGAGVSMVEPSELPSGNELKELITNNLFKNRRLDRFKSQLKINFKYNNIIPEVLFQELYTIIGDRLYDVYQILKLSAPNKIHQILAEFANKYNSKIYTTNFDSLIDHFLYDKSRIVHLHGNINNPDQMTILVHQVGKGLNKYNQKDFYNSTKGKNLYVLGYSGNDKDVIDVINASDINSIYWLMRDINDDWVLRNIQGIKKNTCLIFKSDLNLFFNTIANQLNVRIVNYLKPKNKEVKKNIIKEFNKKHTLFDQFASLALLLFRIQEYGLANEVSKIALSSNIFKTESERITLILYIVDTIRFIGNDYTEGIAYIEQGLNNPEINNNLYLKGQLYNLKGLLYLEDENPVPNKAIPNIKKAISIFELITKNEINHVIKTKSIDFLGKAYHNLGLCYYLKEEYKYAVFNYKRSLIYKKTNGNLIGISTTQVNITLCYLKMKQYSQSKYWECKATDIIEKYNLHYRKAYLHKEKGIILYNEKGLKYLNIALDIYNKYIPSAINEIKQTKQAINAIKLKI